MKGSDQVKKDFAARFMECRAEKGYKSDQEFADALNAKYQEGIGWKGIAKWRLGESIPETKRLPLVCALLDVNIEWLLSGRGPKRPAIAAELNDQPSSTYRPIELDRELLAAIIEDADATIRRRKMSVSGRAKADAVAGAYKVAFEKGETAENYRRDSLTAALEAVKDHTPAQ